MSDLHPTAYRADIDGLRAFAVLSVLIFHAFPQFLPGGFVGVDIFFVISGYLISGILIRQERLELRRFYYRRIRRIFPALIVVLLAALVIGWCCLTAPEFQLLGKHIFKSTLFFQNINLLKEAGYFDLSSELKPLLHLWSLALEEQFYIFWPLIVFLSLRFRIYSQCLTLLLMTSFVLGLIRIMSHHPESAFFEIQFRLWELLAGALLVSVESGHFPKLQTILSRANPNLLSSCGLLMCTVSFFALNESQYFPGFWALLPVLGAVFFMAGKESRPNRFFSSPWLVGIGLISYPLYLWHWPLLSFMSILSPTVPPDSPLGLFYRIACIGISFLLAFMTFVLLERPLQKIHSTMSRRYAIVSLCLIFLLIGWAGFSVQQHAGFPDRPAAYTEMETENDGVSGSDRFKSCSFNIPGIEWCYTTNQNKADVVVIGDSHAARIVPTIENAPYFHGRDIAYMATGSTLGLLQTGSDVGGGVYSRDGFRYLDDAFAWAFEHQVKTIVLASLWSLYFNGHPSKANPTKIRDFMHPDEGDSKIVFQNGLIRTLQTLEQKNIEVLFVYDVPQLNFSPIQCVERVVHLPGAGPKSPCNMPEADFHRDQDGYRSVVSRILSQFASVKTFDPVPHLCHDGFCWGKMGSMVLYFDDNHLTSKGAISLAPYLNKSEFSSLSRSF
jgi:peptidoglycan/LPS O-acetylase OafA/YrhL